MAGVIYIGIAGWSYLDWKGIVYTEPKIDQLEYISGFVDCLEINSTFYRPLDVAQDDPEKLTPKLTPFSTHTAFPDNKQSASLGNERDNLQENDNNDNRLNSGELGKESNHLATAGTGANEMGRGGLEPPTRGFSVRCSTN